MKPRPILPARRLRRISAACLLAVSSGLAVAPAGAQQVWVHMAGEARAALPAPPPGSGFARAGLECGEQVWTLALQPDEGNSLSGMAGPAMLTVGRTPFPTAARTASGRLVIDIPHTAIEPMRAYNRMAVSVPGMESEIAFGLAGSRRAITAVEALCSPRALPSADSIALTPDSQYLDLARRLRRDDIADFAQSTSAQPAIRAGLAELGKGRRLLVAELCGSSWYYGVSGCSLMGFAPVAGGDPDKAGGWRPVYESQGAHLYIDRGRVTDGWPDLRALPLRPGPGMRWAWSGDGYVPAAPAGPQAEAAPAGAVVDGLRR